MNFKNLLLVTAFAAGVPAIASAQDAATDNSIGEVVVTANKRVENVQDVAATVTAVAQEALTRQGVKEMSDISRVAPEVKVQAGALSNVTIRGIRTGAYGPSVESPNAVHIDGVYLSRFSTLQGMFFDVQRVEVLAGPQGTLYGRNSAGGTMNIITNRPGQEFGGNASVELGSYNLLATNAAINIPITDKLAVRAAYYHYGHDGYADNGTDDADQNSARLSALWKPTDRDTLFVTADGETQGGKGAASAKIVSVLKQPSILAGSCAAPPGPPGPAPYYCAVAAGTPGSAVVPINTDSDPRHLRINYGDQDGNSQDTKNAGLQLQYDHDFDWAVLTFQTAYRTTYTDNHNATNSGFTQDPRLVTTGIIRPGAPGGLIAHSKWDSQEIRLTSPSKQALTWVAGLYRFHENSYDNHNYGYAVTYPNAAASDAGAIRVVQPLTLNTDIANSSNVTDAYAVFGQATYTPPVLENLHLTLGARYNSEKKVASGYEFLNGALNAASVFTNANKTWDATTYKVNVAYDLTDDNMIYIDHSTGFKSGGFAYGNAPQYEPEQIKSFEIGTKNRFFDNKLQVNASAWHYGYQNQTTTVFQFYFDNTLGRPNAFLNTTNAKKAEIDGQSMTVDAYLTSDDIINLNATHLDTKYTDYDLGPLYAFAIGAGLAPGATPATFNYTGTPIGGNADWVGNASYTHVFHVFNGDLDAQVAARYTGKQLWGNQASVADVNGYIVSDPYTTVDASLRYQPNGSRWTLTGYVRNIADEDAITTEGYSSSANFLPTSDPRVTYAYRTATYGAPRTFGIIAEAKF